MVAGALILCHGVLGYAHQLERTNAPASPAAHAGGHQGAGAEGGHPSVAYLAALLVALLVHAVPTFLGAKVGVRPPWTSRGRRPVPEVAHPPRGPTLPVLQVFRL